MDISTLPELLRVLPQARQKSKGVFFQATTSGVPELEEGYILKVFRDNVSIKSRGKAGLFYGCQTLHQLIENSRIIPAGRK